MQTVCNRERDPKVDPSIYELLLLILLFPASLPSVPSSIIKQQNPSCHLLGHHPVPALCGVCPCDFPSGLVCETTVCFLCSRQCGPAQRSQGSSYYPLVSAYLEDKPVLRRRSLKKSKRNFVSVPKAIF